jgi:hypothetical protein
VAARWRTFDAAAVDAALRQATGQTLAASANTEAAEALTA